MNIFFKLEQNISQTIYEGLLKIGYSGDENFSIYYDLELLNHLLDTSFSSREECLIYLNTFQQYMNKEFSQLDIALEKKRYKFTVSSEGINSIYKYYENNHFLKDLIELVKTHHFTLDDVLEIFKRYSNDYVCEKSKNPEFQYVIYFKDSNLDPYRYCFAFDEVGGYYHRLLEYDYDKLDLE